MYLHLSCFSKASIFSFFSFFTTIFLSVFGILTHSPGDFFFFCFGKSISVGIIGIIAISTIAIHLFFLFLIPLILFFYF